ncbi:MAG: flagellar protein FliT [Gammaproteobacteria bacterium]|nr:flagellar protein FliT [Gammaproteobacteria bacterium]
MDVVPNTGSIQGSSEQALANALQISREMLELARTGEWPQVIALEERRGLLLQGILSSAHASLIRPAHLREKLEALVAYDEALMSLAREAQQEIISALEQLGKSRQGVSRYHENQMLE